MHRLKPYRATTGLPTQTRRHLMIPTQSHGSQTCADTSSHNYVRTTKLPPYRRFLAARRARNHPFHAAPPRVATSPDSLFQTLPPFPGAESRPKLHSSARHCPAPSFKPPYRKCLGATRAPSASCPEAFPIKENDFPGISEITSGLTAILPEHSH